MKRSGCMCERQILTHGNAVITKVSEAFRDTARGINLEQSLPWHPGTYLLDR
jgi:hypothetical protein